MNLFYVNFNHLPGCSQRGRESGVLMAQGKSVRSRWSVVTKWMGDHSVVGFGPDTEISPESNSVQTLRKSFG